jgi:murein DD-endopeptidase MepM/ murein hydrolase activator NlpD
MRAPSLLALAAAVALALLPRMADGPDAPATDAVVAAAAVPASDAPGTATAPVGDPAATLDGATTAEAVAVDEDRAPASATRPVEVARGDTLLGILVEADVPAPEAHAALAALGPLYDPRRLRVGQGITLHFEPAAHGSRFAGLSIDADVNRTVTVRRTEDGFAADERRIRLERRTAAAAVEIRSSLYESATAEGVPPAVVLAAIRTLAYSFDLQRDLQPGDLFEVLWSRERTVDGETVRDGPPDLLRLTARGRTVAYVRWTAPDGATEWYDGTGTSVRRALLRTPVDGARLSSGFGMRRHPVLGYTAMHRGVDFAAPTGTPVYAAGDGTIEDMGVRGAYGNYVRIRHGRDTATAYAHLSRFATGLRPGQKVRQGQVIGQVGSTGRSTGPHLHFEILRGGTQVNPATVVSVAERRLSGQALAAFRRHAAALEDAFDDARAPARAVAASGTADGDVAARAR